MFKKFKFPKKSKSNTTTTNGDNNCEKYREKAFPKVSLMSDKHNFSMLQKFLNKFFKNV